ncbi:MAG: thioredoxin, partial [Oscillospiraceae bacterium]|nr:thioredoxin [Oscillospiraceae bacterium]
MNILIANSENFKEVVLESKIPVLVDFFADWCGPCQMMGPILEEIATELAGKAKIVKINVDDNPDIAADYGVMSIPNMIIFKNGEKKENFVGVK